ncbi:MAG: NUDIX domain-containing protein [Candidatus Bipolaricaulaceae bacterium]
MAYLYLEIDGKVYTVRRGSQLDLPTRGDPIPFPYRELHTVPWAGQEVVVGIPQLGSFPHQWVGKDDVPGRGDASPLLRACVHASLPRAVAEGIVRRGDELLLVRPSRGLTQGRWTLPGGFLTFGEAPHQGVGREVTEELGVPCRVHELLGVRAKVGSHTGLYWLIFFYRVQLSAAPRPDPDEIAAARYFPKSKAVRVLADETMAAFVAQLPD